MHPIDVAGYTVLVPDWCEGLRSHQVEAIEQIVAAFRRRSVVMLDAPTGAGKTLIGEVSRQILRLEHSFRSGLYVCTTKSLQEQFLHDFPDAKLIKGKANYPTADNPDAFKLSGVRHLDASMCAKRFGQDCANCPDEAFDEDEKLHCFYCHPVSACPYTIAKTRALVADVAVANTAYYLTESNFVGNFGVKTVGGNTVYPFGVVVVDEADTLESVLSNHVQLGLSSHDVKALGLGIPKLVTKPESWIEWLDEAIVVGGAKYTDAANRCEMAMFEPDPKDQKERDRWQNFWSRSKRVRAAIAADPKLWVMEGRGSNPISFKPVIVAPYGREVLWRHAPKWLLMSATLISATQMANDLGLGEHEWEAVSVRSNFPPSRRPIIVRPGVSMTYETKEAAWPKMAYLVKRILDDHPDERILVHTVSYKLAEYLYDWMRNNTIYGHRILTYTMASARGDVLEQYRNKPGAVLFAPSLDRGVDLKDDDCRVQVIAKVPFPNFGDEMVKKRYHGTPTGRGWFATETVRTLVQMTGRGMRHADDSVTTYVLDDQFRTNIWANAMSRSRIPEWWKEALVWEPPT